MPRLAKQLRKPYVRALNKPIVIPDEPQEPAILTGESISLMEKECNYQNTLNEYRTQQTAFISAEIDTKMTLLKEHHGLGRDSEDWYQLALNLAIDHVPGFAVVMESERGRKTVWTPAMHAKLFLDVLNATNGDLDGRLIEAACISLIKKEPWPSFLIGKDYSEPAAKTLQNQFSIARKTPLVMMIQALPQDKKHLAYEFVDFLSKESFP